MLGEGQQFCKRRPLNKEQKAARGYFHEERNAAPETPAWKCGVGAAALSVGSGVGLPSV